MDEMCEIIERNRVDAMIQAMFSLWKKGKLTEQEAADEVGLSLEKRLRLICLHHNSFVYADIVRNRKAMPGFFFHMEIFYRRLDL